MVVFVKINFLLRSSLHFRRPLTQKPILLPQFIFIRWRYFRLSPLMAACCEVSGTQRRHFEGLFVPFWTSTIHTSRTLFTKCTIFLRFWCDVAFLIAWPVIGVFISNLIPHIVKLPPISRQRLNIFPNFYLFRFWRFVYRKTV